MRSRLPQLTLILIAGSALALSGVHAADAGPAPAELLNPFLDDKGAAEKGEELFGRNCQPCHNSRGKGGKGPQLVRGAWGPGGANSDAYMYRTIAGGRPGTPMGAFGASLGSDEIWQIITFLREEAKRVKSAAAANKDEDNLW